MNYLISKQDLIEFDKRPWTMDTSFEEDLNLFLKSKQPVEEIASGEAKRIKTDMGDDLFIGDSYSWDILEKIDDLVCKNLGKQIKIYIQEVQK